VFLLLNPITATVLAGVLLGSVPTPVQLVGGLLVLLGMAAATLPDAVGPGPVALGPGPVADPSGRSAG
jgi:drug/metabolite transporter (DMT)-like permease